MSKRIRILVHHPNESDGTSFYRAYGPLNALQRDHPDKVEIITSERDIMWTLLTSVDILFMQRPASKWHADLLAMALKYGVAVWTDWDDHYLDIPDTNNRKHIYTPYNIGLIKWMAKNSHVVTVSTQRLLEEYSQYNPATRMVRNALDIKYFDLDLSNKYERSNLILWRGSDTHNADFDEYKQEILELMDETKDYVWGFFGYWPEWAVDHLPSNRIRLFANDGVIEYIHTLISLRPKVVYVPLQDIPFNHGKSNIAWIEATYAGATVVCPDNWDEWKALPAFKYTGRENFKKYFHAALSAGSTTVRLAKQHLMDHHTLGEANIERLEIASELTNMKIFVPPPVKIPVPFTDEEFFNYNKEHGWTQENQGWVLGQAETAKYCIEKLNAQSVIDLGCGTGALVEACMNAGIVAMGIDSNPLNGEFFDKRNPEKKDRFICEYLQNVIPSNPFDVAVCIEVLEHIPDEVNEKILAIWSKNCHFFLFSSTPYHTTPEFDAQWGHINVKPTPHWIKFFEKNGFKFIQKLDFPCAWAMLFVSTHPTE